MQETKDDLKKLCSIPAPIVGHVGDGNFHGDVLRLLCGYCFVAVPNTHHHALTTSVCFVIDPTKPEELAEARRMNDRMVRRAIAMDGTCTGEHGIGVGKLVRSYCVVELEFGPAALELMRKLKEAIGISSTLSVLSVVLSD